MQRVRAPEGVPVIPNLVRLISFFFLSSPGRNVEKKEKRKDQRRPGRVTDANAFETESPGKTRVRGGRCAIMHSARLVERAPIFQTIFYRLPHRVWIYLHR